MLTAVVGAFDQVLAGLRGGPERRRRPRPFGRPGHDGAPFPAATLVHGDTTSAMAAALAAAQSGLPVVHVEAGLRTGDLWSPFPEEMNRQLIARLASFHLAPTFANEANLIREGVDERRVFVTGNTGLDALRWAAAHPVPFDDDRLTEVDASDAPVVVVTAHRRENWGGGLARIADGVARVAAARPDVRIVVPLHPNPRVRAELEPALGPLPNVLLCEPLGYAPFARLLARATLAISDSGGIQEEAPSVGTPVLVTRESSERQEGVEAGTLLLVGTDPDVIATETLRLLSDKAAYRAMVEATNPFGDGRAAERIVAAFEHLAFGEPPPAPFGAGFSRDAVLRAAGYDASGATENRRDEPDRSEELDRWVGR